MTIDRLILAKKKSSLNTELFAESIGVSTHTYRSWRNGKTNIPKPIELLINLMYFNDDHCEVIEKEIPSLGVKIDIKIKPLNQ